MNESRPIHVNEHLGYAVHKLGKLPLKNLKSILTNFYSLEAAYVAKETLVGYVDGLSINKWPRVNLRRRKDSLGSGGDTKQLESKMKNEIDDVIAVLTYMYIDEKQLESRLPGFVASNPDMLPSSNWVEGDMVGLINKFASLDSKLSDISEI